MGVNDGTINSSYFDIQTTGQADNGVGKGLTSLQMKQSGNFTGFDSNTWVIYEDRTNPLLGTFLTPLTVTVNASGNKTYDGTTNCGTIVCEVSYITTGTKTVDGTASYVLSSKNAGSVNVYASGLYSDQQGYLISYATGTAATIDKKTLTVGGTTAAGKTYDGTKTATITVGKLSGFVDGEEVSASASGTFDSKDAGSRSATASYTLNDGTGSASNYTLADTTGHSANIGKAALYYNANNSSFSVGTTPSPLSGTVSGFVNNETQSTATTGTLAWTTSATSASGAGSYAINGSGLLADNYNFSQAVENATALTLTQSVSIVPVVNPPALPSDTSFVKPAPLPQASLPFNVAENINTLPATAAVSADINTLAATAAGSVPSTSLNVTKAFGSSGMLFAQGNGVRLPATYYQSTLADPAQNP